MREWLRGVYGLMPRINQSKTVTCKHQYQPKVGNLEGVFGCRPTLNIPNDQSMDGAYTLVWNQEATVGANPNARTAFRGMRSNMRGL